MKHTHFFLLMLMAFQAVGQLNQELYRDFPKYMDSSIVTRRFKHEDIVRAIGRLGKEFRVRQVGVSAEGRSINMVSYGHGPINVLMWSQMHGDETTATRAILDVFRFLRSKDGYDELRERVQTAVTWHFIPMLNPDGAARFTRRNRDGIDVNRDALRLQTPEGSILKRIRDSLNADWGFNLHDQSRGVSVNGKPATLSLLAPPFNPNRDVNETRGDAMKLIRMLHDQVIGFIPGQIGLYADDFEPRAFGDNIQKWGTRTILIESGGFADDWEKQSIRRLNFVMLLTAVEAIGARRYKTIPVDLYHEIPSNSDGRMLEVIVRNVKYNGVLRDIGWDRREVDSDDFRRYYARGFISDIGDLSTSSAYVTFDATGYDVTIGETYNTVLETINQLQRLPLDQLIGQGFTEFLVKGTVDRFSDQPKVNVMQPPAPPSQDLKMGANPSLLFWKNGLLTHVLINGRLHKL